MGVGNPHRNRDIAEPASEAHISAAIRDCYLVLYYSPGYSSCSTEHMIATCNHRLSGTLSL